MNFYVYVISDPRKKGPFKYGTCTAQYEPIYVGMGQGKRYIQSAKCNQSNPYKANKLNRIRTSGHEPIVRIVRRGLTLAQAYALEVKLISVIGRNSSGGPLTNLTAGGEGVNDPSPATRRRMSKSAKARGIPQAQRDKITASLTDRKFTDEQRARMSAGCLKRGSYGPLSEEHKQRLSASLIGHKKPPRKEAHRQKLSEANTTCFATYKGKTKPLMQWCRELNLKYTTTNMRITKGWTVKEAFTIPVGQRRNT